MSLRSDVYDIMRDMIVTMTIKFRRGSTDQWTSSNRVLEDGEPGWDSTTKKLYVGDGVTPFAGLTPIEGGGGGGGTGGSGSTNLSVTRTPTGVTVASDTGADAVIPTVDTNAGVMSAALKTKLDGVAPGATVNDTDANLKARANHTGTQAIATVAGLQAALDAKGTSNLALGTTSSTALRGNVTVADLGGLVGTGVSNVVVLSQAGYDALPTPDPTTLYVIT